MATVEIVEYQAAWADAFRDIADELTAAMTGCVIAVEHIGSTAVPGLCAKPVLDVMLGIDDLADVASRLPGLLELGYRYRPEYEAQIPQRRYFVREASSALPRVHVHAVLLDGQLWRNHIAFRNALWGDAQLRDQYACLKRALAGSLSKSAYTEAKAPFIHGVLQTASEGDIR